MLSFSSPGIRSAFTTCLLRSRCVNYVYIFWVWTLCEPGPAADPAGIVQTSPSQAGSPCLPLSPHPLPGPSASPAWTVGTAENKTFTKLLGEGAEDVLWDRRLSQGRGRRERGRGGLSGPKHFPLEQNVAPLVSYLQPEANPGARSGSEDVQEKRNSPWAIRLPLGAGLSGEIWGPQHQLEAASSPVHPRQL